MGLPFVTSIWRCVAGEVSYVMVITSHEWILAQIMVASRIGLGRSAMQLHAQEFRYLTSFEQLPDPMAWTQAVHDRIAHIDMDEFRILNRTFFSQHAQLYHKVQAEPGNTVAQHELGNVLLKARRIYVTVMRSNPLIILGSLGYNTVRA